MSAEDFLRSVVGVGVLEGADAAAGVVEGLGEVAELPSYSWSLPRIVSAIRYPIGATMLVG